MALAPWPRCREGARGSARSRHIAQRRAPRGSAGAPVVALAAGHELPGDAGGLVGERHGDELGRLALEQAGEPGRGPGAAAPDLLDVGGRARHQGGAQALVAGPGDAAEPLLAGGRMVLRASGRARPRTVGRSGRRADDRSWRPSGRRRPGRSSAPRPGAGSARCCAGRPSASCRCWAMRGASSANSSPSMANISLAIAGHGLDRRRCAPAAARSCASPLAATRPNSAAWPRMMLLSCVRRWIRLSRVPSSICAADCSALLTGTSRSRTRGRLIASQIASASILSFLLRPT